MLRRIIAPSLLALTMVFGAVSASFGEAASDSTITGSAAPSVAAQPTDSSAQPTNALPADSAPKGGAGSCAAQSGTESSLPDAKGTDSSNPCDTACECCGQWNVPTCCDKCWTCWIGG